MPAAIGLRFYRLFVRGLRDREKKDVPASELSVPLSEFLTRFVDEHSAEEAVSDAEKERSYYFEPRETYGLGSIRGHVRYGTFGFESRIKKHKSKTVAYIRKSSDVEEIPLFFDAWSPPSEDFSILALQSYGGKSCVHLILFDMMRSFEALNPGFRLHAHKLLGNDSPQTLFARAPVKKITFVKHNAHSDRFSSYRNGKPPKPIDIEVSYKAKRGGILGSLEEMGSAFIEDSKGLLSFEGMEFDEATAEVMIGNRRRPVGLIGPTSETGAIDVSPSIEYGLDGHPTYESILRESSDIATHFFKKLKAS